MTTIKDFSLLKEALEENKVIEKDPVKEDVSKNKIQRKRVEGLSKRILKNEGGKIYTLTLGKEVGLEAITVPGSSFLEHFQSNEEMIFVRKGVVEKADSFIRDIIYVTFKGKFGRSWFERIRGGVFIDHNGKETKLYAKAHRGKVWDIVKNEIVPKPKGFSDLREYSIIGATPSMMRKSQVFMGSIHCPWTKILTDITVGGYEKKLGRPMELKDFNKAFSRVFQWAAPHQDLGELENIVIYNGYFGGKPFVADGKSYFAASKIASLLSDSLGVSISPESVLGIGVQERVGTSKGSATVLQDQTLTELMAGKEVHYYDPKEMTDEDVKEVFERHPGDFIQFGEGTPQYMVDLNTMKSDFDPRIKPRAKILAFAKRSRAATDIQMLQKIATADPKGLESLIRRLFTEFADRKLQGFHDEESQIVNFKEIKNLHLLGIIEKVAPAYLKKDKKLFQQVLDRLNKELMKAVNLMRFPIDGLYGTLEPDFARVLTDHSVIRFGEFFSAGANQHFNTTKDKKRLGFLIKHPSVGGKEFYQGVCLTLGEVCRRIDALPVKDRIKEQLKTYYAHLTDGMIVVPASEELMKLCAGLDYDFDGGKLILDTEANAILEKVAPLLVNIQAPEPKRTTEIPFNVVNFPTLIRQSVMAKGKSIGEITYMNDALLTKISMVKAGQFHLVLPILKKILCTVSDAEEDYTPLPHYIKRINGRVQCVESTNVSHMVIEQWRAHLTEVRITEDNAVQILEDLNAFFRYYQEITIDSVKTGVAVNVKFEVAIFPETTKPLGIHFNHKKGVATVYLQNPEKDELLVGIIDKMRRRAAMGVKQRLEAAHKTFKGFSDEDLLCFESVLNEDPSLKYALVEMKKIYTDVARASANATEEAGDNEELIDEINKSYKRQLASIGNMTRRLFKQAGNARGEVYAPAERGLVAKGVSMMSDGGLSEDGGNAFASAVLQEEYLLMISKYFGETGTVGTKLVFGDDNLLPYKEGDKVRVLKGQLHGAVTQEIVTGSMVIKELNREFYATTSLDGRIIKPPAIDSNEIIIRLHGRSLNEYVIKELENVGKILVSANKDYKDRLYDVETGEEIASIQCEIKTGDVRFKHHAEILDGAYGTISGIYTHSWKDEASGQIRYGCFVAVTVDSYKDPEEILSVHDAEGFDTTEEFKF